VEVRPLRLLLYWRLSLCLLQGRPHFGSTGEAIPGLDSHSLQKHVAERGGHLRVDLVGGTLRVGVAKGYFGGA
jgi:hypothetical protein